LSSARETVNFYECCALLPGIYKGESEGGGGSGGGGGGGDGANFNFENDFPTVKTL